MDWVKVAFREDSFDEENEVGGRFLKDVVDNLVGEGHARPRNAPIENRQRLRMCTRAEGCPLCKQVVILRAIPW